MVNRQQDSASTGLPNFGAAPSATLINDLGQFSHWLDLRSDRDADQLPPAAHNIATIIGVGDVAAVSIGQRPFHRGTFATRTRRSS